MRSASPGERIMERTLADHRPACRRRLYVTEVLLDLVHLRPWVGRCQPDGSPLTLTFGVLVPGRESCGNHRLGKRLSLVSVVRVDRGWPV